MDLAQIIYVLAATALAAVILPTLVLAIGARRDRQRLAATAIAELDDELNTEFAKFQPIPWSAYCTTCGWNAPVGPSRGYFLARSEAEAAPRLRAFHDAQLRASSPVLLAGAYHRLAVFPLNERT